MKRTQLKTKTMNTEQTPIAEEIANETQIRAHLIKLLTTLDAHIVTGRINEPLAIERFKEAAALFPHLNFMSIRHESR